MIRVSADGTVKGDYWKNLAEFEHRRSLERASTPKTEPSLVLIVSKIYPKKSKSKKLA